MGKFEYRFQSIEEVKEKIKKNSEREFALVLIKINEKLAEIDFVKKELEDSYKDVKIMNPQEMIFLEKYRNSLKTKLKKKGKELSDLENEKRKKQAELTKHHKEHKVFVKLREKQFNDYQNDQKKLDQKSTDEMANQKFNTKEQ